MAGWALYNLLDLRVRHVSWFLGRICTTVYIQILHSINKKKRKRLDKITPKCSAAQTVWVRSLKGVTTRIRMACCLAAERDIYRSREELVSVARACVMLQHRLFWETPHGKRGRWNGRKKSEIYYIVFFVGMILPVTFVPLYIAARLFFRKSEGRCPG